ncbi:MAG: hypothetical protein M1835_006682 [Candelina submexicana]|nr:MAG: hypothetical protein M1835_006682 [Candelina submexicana]
MDEILSLRPPYMPYKDFHRPHFLRESGENAGTSRLLDTLFRQLRYDSTEQIIDICYRACQILTFPPQEDILTSDYQFSHATPKGSRFMLFRDICFEESLFHETKGLVLRLSYACPKFLRGRWMHSSGLFEEGMLVALVGLDDIDHALSTTFFEVVLRESTDAMNARGGNGQRASIQLSFAQRNSQDDVRRMLYYSQGVLRGRFVLVDFPKLLLAGFSATLKQLQNQYHKYRLPFATHIAPSDPRSVNLKIEPPTYTKSSGFSFDLNSLRRQDARKPDLQMTSVELDLANGRPEIFREQLETATTLDQGQALALSQNLSRGLTFTQGPPGTGKSYLGVSLTKAVVSSQNGANAKPVLAVCMTNHALDSFLEDLVKDGITQVARLGAGSKVEWTKPYTLRELSHKIKLTQLESHNLLRPRIRVEALHREGTRWCESLSTSDLSWCSVRNHLTEKYPDIYRQFLALEKPEHSFEGHRAIRHAGGFGFHCWKSGLDIRALNTLSVEFATYLGVDPSTGDTSGSGTRVIESLLAEIVSRSRNLDAIVSSGTSIWSMSPTERTSMVEKWKMEIGPRKFVEQLGEIHRRHQVALLEKKKATQDIDARCLESRQVIGLTTTACATYWPLLHRLGLKVIICEEAGEVMEAHTLCTLFPSIEHAIFIGDPLQLRPQITERALSLETKGGRDYRLDESLFERLMFPSTPGVLPIQPSQLNLQRRMHPDIADISRATLYPYLQDHDSTFKHPAVVGMANRMYWFDHSHSEDPLDSRSATFKSCSNAFEVEMVAGLVQYLIAGNAYDLQDVAILTPYNGQLAALTKRLRSTCSIWLSEKDRETLVDGGFLSVEEAATGGRVQIDLINMLRIATIDNFQGEEAKIIIMSTVRSNLDDRVGFLKTKNRINVACSRARDGFYIIGNAALMRKVEMWDRIVLGSGELPSLPSVGCPTCGGPLTEVRRYAILYKIKDTPKVLDRMIAKFGRKVSIWHRELVEREELLRAKFLWFCREISPGPGAVKSNQELVRERGNWYMDIQSRIYRFLEEVVRPFERNVLDIASLTEARIFRRPVFAFALRLELLFRRCRLETLLEARRMADFLQRQDDPTEQLQTIAKGLLSTVDEQSAQNIRQITFANEDCKERRLPALEVEFTLSQLAFFATSRRNDDEATSNAVANYDRALDLCGKFPDTAGRFFRCCRLAKRATDGLEPPEQTYAAEPRDHWRKWGKHATGHLSYCDNGHPYSTVTFDGCPECGREVNLMPAAEPVDYESYLNKDAFLQALERRVGSGSHAGGSSSLTRSKEPGS